MTPEEFKALKPWDVVRNTGSQNLYTVINHSPDGVLLVRTYSPLGRQITATNPDEWTLVYSRISVVREIKITPTHLWKVDYTTQYSCDACVSKVGWHSDHVLTPEDSIESIRQAITKSLHTGGKLVEIKCAVYLGQILGAAQD